MLCPPLVSFMVILNKFKLSIYREGFSSFRDINKQTGYQNFVGGGGYIQQCIGNWKARQGILCLSKRVKNQQRRIQVFTIWLTFYFIQFNR